MRSNKSKNKQQHPSNTASHSSVKVDGTSAVRSASHISGLYLLINYTESTYSIIIIGKKTNVKSGSKTELGTIVSSVRSASKSSPMSVKTGSKTKSSTKSAKATGKHQTQQSKHTRIPIKDRTETCAVQFVPKFNSSSTKNQVPIYHLIRHAFGNMVREAICQLDKEKSGVSSQQIIDHILKHYSFPQNISQSAIRNRTIFTINAGLRAGTLLTVSPNKGVRIGRMRRIYPRMLG
ncbi:unnamed protein product [Rotaria sp. Silwood1]|nr:unnamed protein product [Rotaria sp. Silwood1]CAF3343722.1 unnamed protein product [Rotaria sp. Silwood1]